MGQPEDYIIEEDNLLTAIAVQHPEKQKNYTEILKRDDQRVSAGLGHYFGIDAVWVRILFILLVWGAGTESLLILFYGCCSCCSNNLRETGNDGRTS
jgi:phage shock protein PspC (stress-responsive transcriptional regulator)